MKDTTPRLLACAALLAAGLSREASAQQPFLSFDARSVAMGGASVGLADGAGAALANPAALGERRVDPIASAGVLGMETGSFFDPLKIVTGNSPLSLSQGASNAAEVRSALTALAEGGNGILGDERLGMVYSSGGWGVSVVRRSWSAATPRIDLTHVQSGSNPATSFAFNSSSIAYRSLSLDDIGVTKSYSLVAGINVGATLRVLRGTTYSKEESAFVTEVGDPVQMTRRAGTGVERTRTRFSYDLGALLILGPVKIGGVVMAVNQPTFPFDEETGPLADRGRGITHGRHTRIGASVHFPVVGLTIAADLDLNKKETLVLGLESRQVGGGAEFRLGPIALRGGVSLNLEEAARTYQYTGGAGVKLGPVSADGAVLYRPGKASLGAVLTARVSM